MKKELFLPVFIVVIALLAPGIVLDGSATEAAHEFTLPSFYDISPTALVTTILVVAFVIIIIISFWPRRDPTKYIGK